MSGDAVAATRTRLLAVSAVTDLVGTRVYWEALPQGATLPAIVLELNTSECIDRHLAGTGVLFESSVNVYCYADTHTASVALGDAVYTALEFQSGTWGTVSIKRVYVENTQDVTEPPRDGSQAARRVRALFVSIWHD